MKNVMEIKEVKECTGVEEVNKYLESGWVLLNVFYETQRCFQRVTDKKGVERIQAFDKVVKIFVIGKEAEL